MVVFQHLIPADESLFFSRNDENDLRLGDIVFRKSDDYADAQVVLVGCPQDEGVRRNLGRTGARRAPAEVRRALYRFPVSEAHENLRLFDAGDVRIATTLEETHERLFESVQEMLAGGKDVVVIGGGNDISYPDCRALADFAPRPLVLNVDRHLDVRIDNQRNSGTPYRQLIEEDIICPTMFHEVGINTFANSSAYMRYVEEKGANIHFLGDIRDAGVARVIRKIVDESDAQGIFFGIDIDVVRAVEAPGVSDPGPMGLTARELCEIADVAAMQSRVRLIEITEVNPDFDRDGITSKLAANFIMRALADETKDQRNRA